MSKPKPQGPNITTKRIKELMEEQRYTQARFAEALGVAPQTIHRWVNGKTNICQDSLEKIADTLNTTVHYLRGLPGAYRTKDELERAKDLHYELLEAGYYDNKEKKYVTDDNEADQQIKYDRQRRVTRDSFFLRELGYSYFESPDLGDFSGVFCTLKDQNGQEYEFTFEEFQQLLSQIKEKVDYACFKKRNTVRNCGGMKSIDPLERR